MNEEILGFISDLFYGPFFMLAKIVWDWCMGLCTGIMGKTPMEFSPQAWTYVENTLYPWAIGIGVSLMNIFFILGFCRAAANFKENITLEVCIEALLRLVCLNIVLQKGLDIIKLLFQISSVLSADIMSAADIPLYTTDADIGAHLFWWMFGFGYFIVALVCAVIIFLTLYGRYIKLYCLVVFYPLAMPTIVAGRGIDATAFAWIKSFISNVFEIVVIALVMAIAGTLIAGFSSIDMPVLEYFDGAGQAISSLLSMILMTASVKGASVFLNKSFAL